MIASLHPCITKDLNILCAGRSLTDREKMKLQKARAVIVAQGVTAEVYRECRRLVPQVFPNYDLRFPLEGKVGDGLLFEYYQVPHPKTLIFENRETLEKNYPDPEMVPFLLSGYPYVFKANLGGEGAFVFLIRSEADLSEKLAWLPKGDKASEGFVLQERVDHGGRDLRVAVIFDALYAYWRVQENPEVFYTNLSRGGRIVPIGEASQEKKALRAVKEFCRRSGINLAGFDILFDRKNDPTRPLFLEINYYFGRRGLGGSLRFYELLSRGADRWLASLDQPRNCLPIDH